MTPRTKKLVGLIILLPAMFVYFIAIIIIADFIPANKLIQILFFAITGIIWVFPLKPLFMWINRE